MAAVTVTTNDTASNRDRAGDKVIRAGIVAAGGSDTWASGIPGITELAWIPALSTDHCAPTFSGSTITFNAAGAVNGTVLVFARG